ncbi:hypothetical protein J5Y03_11500 [Bacillus sp. RG28]|uniref:Uncharacterized protein n=1 Tax=Gottfriedia endophytica TaxID=2820819 RepID=A0A940NND0_9BACI|nr:hypothetical protein [Gottfriedia endophytica]MBP0725796.1 hypothetical protein [Gottfriedia endophytica]
MKLFCKVAKKITVNNFIFHCIINEIPSNDSVSFKVYSSKTSFFEVHFTWEGSSHFNLHRPQNCASIIKYAIEHGWGFRQDKKTMKIEQGDFLIDKIGLCV